MRLLLREGPINVAVFATILLLLPFCSTYTLSSDFSQTVAQPILADAFLIGFSLAIPLGLDALLDSQLPRVVTGPRLLLISAQLVNSINQKHALVEVEFSVGTSNFKIIRGIKPNVFEIWKDSKMINQSSHQQKSILISDYFCLFTDLLVTSCLTIFDHFIITCEQLF